MLRFIIHGVLAEIHRGSHDKGRRDEHHAICPPAACPSVADLVALPSQVSALLKMLNDTGNHFQSVGVTVQRLGAEDSSSVYSVQSQPPPTTSFRIRMGQLHLRFVRRRAPSARRQWPRTGRPWCRPQQGRLRGPLPASARCWSMRGRHHRWPLQGHLRWQSWRASSSHRVPLPFCSALQVSTLSPLAGFHFISSAADCGKERGDGACLRRGERHGAGLVVDQKSYCLAGGLPHILMTQQFTCSPQVCSFHGSQELPC